MSHTFTYNVVSSSVHDVNMNDYVGLLNKSRSSSYYMATFVRCHIHSRITGYHQVCTMLI